MTFKELNTIYKNYFTLGFLGKSISNKFALISLICYITNKMKEKKPDVTFYSVVYKLGLESGLTDEEIYSLSIICEDFAFGCTEFPTFDIKPKDMPKKIKELLKERLPF